MISGWKTDLTWWKALFEYEVKYGRRFSRAEQILATNNDGINGEKEVFLLSMAIYCNER